MCIITTDDASHQIIQLRKDDGINLRHNVESLIGLGDVRKMLPIIQTNVGMAHCVKPETQLHKLHALFPMDNSDHIVPKDIPKERAIAAAKEAKPCHAFRSPIITIPHPLPNFELSEDIFIR